MSRFQTFVRPASLVLIGLTTLAVAPRAAHAGVFACGNIEITASASSQLVTKDNCTTQCTTTSFEACCAAKLEQDCESQCNATADTSCTTSCQNDCSTKCVATLDCTTDCQSRCSSSCSASCSSSGGSADCSASCGACCSDHCDTKCTSVPPSADCSTKCNASCTGACTAEANSTCQIDCQAKSYPQCKNDFVQTCTTQCGQPTGALFCDGNYVDVGGNLAQCVDALNAILTAKIDISVTGSGDCTGNDCSGQATASGTSTTTKVGCAASPSSPASGGPLAAIGAALALAVAGARRKSRRSDV